jgi:hypothetical protein
VGEAVAWSLPSALVLTASSSTCGRAPNVEKGGTLRGHVWTRCFEGD